MTKLIRSILLIVVLVGLFAVGAGGLTGCSLICDTAKYKESVMPLLTEWDDAAKLANRTPRMSLPPMIERMQSIRRNVAAVEVQSCLEDTHAILLKSMDYQIDGFISFMAKDPDAIVQNYFTRSDAAIQEWTDALAKK